MADIHYPLCTAAYYVNLFSIILRPSWLNLDFDPFPLFIKSAKATAWKIGFHCLQPDFWFLTHFFNNLQPWFLCISLFGGMTEQISPFTGNRSATPAFKRFRENFTALELELRSKKRQICPRADIKILQPYLIVTTIHSLEEKIQLQNLASDCLFMKRKAFLKNCVYIYYICFHDIHTNYILTIIYTLTWAKYSTIQKKPWKYHCVKFYKGKT